jgi:hypothetical protein
MGERSETRISAGAFVIVVLREPKEKCWGALDSITDAGVYLRGLDLLAFDDWTRAIAGGETFIAPADMFFPMWRIERITRDEATGEIPSLAEQLEERTGQSARHALGLETVADETHPVN